MGNSSEKERKDGTRSYGERFETDVPTVKTPSSDDIPSQETLSYGVSPEFNEAPTKKRKVLEAPELKIDSEPSKKNATQHFMGVPHLEGLAPLDQSEVSGIAFQPEVDEDADTHIYNSPNSAVKISEPFAESFTDIPTALEKPNPTGGKPISRAGKRSAPELFIESKQGTGSRVLSATMRLLIQGIDEEPTENTENTEDAIEATPGTKNTKVLKTQKAIRTIQPTILGWVVILVIVLGSVGFAIYKKSSSTSDDLLDELESMDLGDLKNTNSVSVEPLSKKSKEKAPSTKGQITLNIQPENASVFLHVGESPLTVDKLNPKMPHLFRFERQGYRITHKTLLPEDFKENYAAFNVPLEPMGIGEGSVPKIEISPPKGMENQKGSVEIKTEPPAASVWRWMGKNKVYLEDVPIGRYYFKVVKDQYQPSFVHVSAVEFKKANYKVIETVDMTPVSEKGNSPDVVTEIKTEKKPKKKRRTWRRKRRPKKPKIKTPSWAN